MSGRSISEEVGTSSTLDHTQPKLPVCPAKTLLVRFRPPPPLEGGFNFEVQLIGGRYGSKSNSQPDVFANTCRRHASDVFKWLTASQK